MTFNNILQSYRIFLICLRTDEGSIEGIYVGNGRVLEFEKEHVYQITGVWDLPMVGNEKIDVKHRYQELTSGPPLELIGFEGAFVERSNGVMCQLQESFGDCYGYSVAMRAQFDKLRRLELSKSHNRRKEKLLILRREKLEKLKEIESEWNCFNKYYPAAGLPKDSVLVVRTDALREFEELIADNLVTQTNSKIKGDDGVGIKTPTERQSQLYIFIWRVHQFLSQKKKPTAQKLWNEIQYRHGDHDTDKIIQEVDHEHILWCSGYDNEQKLQRSSFDKTLSNIRKTPPF